MALHHVSHLCRDVEVTKHFYMTVLGFEEVRRPASFEFEGSWLCGHGIGVHLIKGQPPHRSRPINPQDSHVSFVAEDLDALEAYLHRLGVPTCRQLVVEGGVEVTQLFFHDPDANMIEICNCNCIPIIPLRAPRRTHTDGLQSSSTSAASSAVDVAPDENMRARSSVDSDTPEHCCQVLPRY